MNTLSRRAFFRSAGVGAWAVWNAARLPGDASGASEEGPFPRRLPPPPFPADLEWINASGPLSLQELRGKFVLLDFWTLGCINCMHIIPALQKLENAWANELVVIGVHSGKFENEKSTRSIREAVQRYHIQHPVVNDPQYVLWNRFGVQAWPSLVLIDPEGYAVWWHSGEATFEQINAVLKKSVPFYRRKGLLDLQPRKIGGALPRTADSPLWFPGKVLADAPGDRLLIADSGHNRLVLTRLDGSWLATIGSGEPGRDDGDFATAKFNAPQGMALVNDVLYVADTWNHLIRKVDLASRRVTTVAGTGQQSRQPPFGRFDKPLATALSSPWDVLAHGDSLFIAMAGWHQIWVMRLDGSGIAVYAGNGREDIVDGPIRPRRLHQPGFAEMAQPSGLASDGRWLYAADSEGSSIRAMPLSGRGEVRTLVGTAALPGARLFTFGDVDGRGSAVRLQHPLGLAFDEGKLYVADTYNNKLKVIDPTTGDAKTLLGGKQPGKSDVPAAFHEPGGLSAAGGRLFVADTNNHAIRVVDLREANRTATLTLTGLR